MPVQRIGPWIEDCDTVVEMRALDAVKLAGLALLALVLWVARDVLPPFVLAGILAYLLSPLVDELAERLKLPRAVPALGVTFLLVGGLVLVGWLLGGRLVTEVRALEREGPDIVESVITHLAGGPRVDVLGQSVSARAIAGRLNASLNDAFGSPGDAFRAVRLAVDATLNVFLGILALVYLLIDGKQFGRYGLRFVAPRHRPHVVRVAQDIHKLLGRYLRGQLVLIVLMSLVTFVALEWIFHLPYALWLGVLTGLLEVIPIVGPITAGAIATGVGLVQSGPSTAGAIVVLYFVLRQLEDQLVMPQVVGRAVHVHPLVTIFAVLAGERVAGVLGMVMAVPVAAAVNVAIRYVYPPLTEGERAEEAPPQRTEGAVTVATGRSSTRPRAATGKRLEPGAK